MVQVADAPVQLAYYFEGEKFTGEALADEKYQDHWYVHQARLRGTLYSNDVFSVGAEYRYQFASEDVTELNGKEMKLENNRHIAILNASYNLTENLTLAGYYQYEFNKYDDVDFDGKEASRVDDYYGEFGLGWTYNF